MAGGSTGFRTAIYGGAMRQDGTVRQRGLRAGEKSQPTPDRIVFRLLGFVPRR
jgi:hypothetical protein